MVVHQTSSHPCNVVDTIPLRPSPDHHLRVCHNSAFPALFQQENEVLQGAVLSVTLRSGSALLVCQSQYLCYVDDVAICHSSQRMVRLEHGLQIAIRHLSCHAVQNTRVG
jgi:hypothetical protein